MASLPADTNAQDGEGARPVPEVNWGSFRRTQEIAEEIDYYPNESPRVLGGLFVDGEGMKEQMKNALLKPEYSVTKYYKTTGWPQMIARHSLFENITLGVIAFNALWIAIDTDYNDATTLLDADPIFQVAEHFFAVYFFSEWLIRFLSFEKKRNGLRDAWFVFDSVLVFMMVMETWVMTVILAIAGGGGSGGLGNASILRLLRLLRLSRLLRMLRSMPELMIMVKGMASAASSVLFTLLLLALTLYVFAIAFVQMTSDSAVGQKYFSGVARAIYSLVLFGTFVDNISVVSSEIWGITSDGNTVLGIMFFLFVIMSALMVMNMLIGVLCEVVSAVSSVETERMNISYVKGKMEHIIGYGNTINKGDFVKLLDNREAMVTFNEVGVDPVVMVTMVDSIFGDAETLNFADFMEAVLRLRGDNQATVKDFIELTKYFRESCRTLEDIICPRTTSRKSTRRSKPVSRRNTVTVDEVVRKESRQSVRTEPDRISDPVRKPTQRRSRSMGCLDSAEEQAKSASKNQRPALPLKGVSAADPADNPMSSQSTAVARIQPMKLDMLLRASLLEATKLQGPPPNGDKGEAYDGLHKWAETTEASLRSALMDFVQLKGTESAYYASDPLSPCSRSSLS